jgi:4'-phosphopantetheinyl transferase
MRRYLRVSVEETLTGAPGIVDVWCYFYEQHRDAALVAAQAALMGQDEVTRCAAFRFEDDRHMFLSTRALVRCTLSAYCDVPPAEWKFSVGPHDKPRIQAPVTATPLHFNLAHTRGLVVCAVSVAHELVGVDVECTNGRRTDALAVADRFFSPAEASDLRRLPVSEQDRRFLEQWTLKESYVKANGWGLTAPLDRFSFTVGDIAGRFIFDSQLDAAPALWRYESLDLSSHHIGAVCAKTGGQELSLRIVESVPLMEQTSR